ncbi:MAG: hypothetical protein H6Q33_4574, partial [Deltaproteobacteria bacterium]|nr:hypothetical protein [Deltaproteobacteria bacterium]
MSAPRAAGGAHGLVCSATSDTQAAGQGLSGLVAIDPLLRRLSRMSRVVRTAARCIADGNPHLRAAMVTLTYRDDVEWTPRQVSDCL